MDLVWRLLLVQMVGAKRAICPTATFFSWDNGMMSALTLNLVKRF